MLAQGIYRSGRSKVIFLHTQLIKKLQDVLCQRLLLVPVILQFFGYESLLRRQQKGEVGHEGDGHDDPGASGHAGSKV